MREAIQSIFKSQRQGSGSAQKPKGFTLIELLVAIILAALVITPLLGFMINLLTTDRREQAKSTTEQDLQSALDYIARDLEQAIYIYDGEGIQQIQEVLPSNIDLNSSTEDIPVLAFWKRKNLPDAVDRNFEFDSDPKLCQETDEEEKETECNDYFVYSLVAYYLINPDDSNGVWSQEARIGRFEISDGIRNPNDPDEYMPARTPDPGFQLFDREGSESLEQAMNAWQPADAISGVEAMNQTNVLVDYIDDDTAPLEPAPEDYCLSPLGLDNGNLEEREEDKEEPKEPRELNTLPEDEDFEGESWNSFFACVDTKATVAQVYLRGNALARIQNDADYEEDSPYFPEATIKVEGRGFIK